MINVISEDKVIEHDIPTHRMPAMRIHEPLKPGGTLVDRKVVGKVGIPQENWESQQSADFVVAPLQQHDAILGMPFLATEGILIDPARGRVHAKEGTRLRFYVPHWLPLSFSARTTQVVI
jgi:hypothetical protein